MIFPLPTLLLAAFSVNAAVAATVFPRQIKCASEQKIAAIQAELKTIASHSAMDAASIPLAANATRTFFLTPTELGGATLEINVGIDATTVRLELVALATALNAGVPPSSVSFIVNNNGSVTSDFIQTDNVVLQSVNVREIHYFDDNCDITTILGFVHGDLLPALLDTLGSHV